MVTYVDGPFYPDGSLSAKQAKETLRNAAFETMEKRSENSDAEYIRYVRAEDEKTPCEDEKR